MTKFPLTNAEIAEQKHNLVGGAKENEQDFTVSEENVSGVCLCNSHLHNTRILKMVAKTCCEIRHIGT